ncbi:MAG: Chondramide synthase cmdD [Syntrophorhabdaceae bacterium PtaU1.Bin034]|nr:MAG: Chondramide synthase cmdD [Syntrophorhabdaceae bacterium PtaU1.Bin034]
MKVCDCVPGFEFDEERDLEESPAWFLDATHSVPPWSPMFGWFWVNFCRHGMQYGADALQLPTTKGWDWRFKNGGGYLTILLVESKEERARREDGFRKAIRPFLEDYDGLWNSLIVEILARYEKIKAVDGTTASNVQLLDNFEYAIDTCRRMWEIHMYMMYGTYMPYVLFEQLCKQLVGIDDTHPTFLKLMSGFDNESFRVDKGLWELARKARKMGLKETITESPLKEVVGRLEAIDEGRQFLEEFRLFLKEKAGWRMERMAEVNIPTWGEEPVLALDRVRTYLKMGRDHDLDAERIKREGERREAENEVLQKIAPEQRKWFSALMRIAQNSSRFSEEHNHYLDLYTHALIRKTCLDMGRRFVKFGALDDAEDIFFLIPDEVRKAGINPDKFKLQSIVSARRLEWKKWAAGGNPPVILRKGFGLDKAIDLMVSSLDPIALKVVVGKLPEARPELKADLYGTCGSPGVAEGPARVVLNEDDLASIQEGDILVAASTSPSWTPIYGLIRGVVVDRGGALSHAAIVGREYGIPVVMNVFEGTAKIKSGQRVRIDANLGTVVILEKR